MTIRSDKWLWDNTSSWCLKELFTKFSLVDYRKETNFVVKRTSGQHRETSTLTFTPLDNLQLNSRQFFFLLFLGGKIDNPCCQCLQNYFLPQTHFVYASFCSLHKVLRLCELVCLG